MRIHAYYSPNQNQVPVLSKAWGWGDHLYGARAPAGPGFAPIDASRGDDERVFDSLHRAGIDIKLVGNPTNGFSGL